MSEVKVNKISPRSGTTVTLGDSGDTFTIPSGATINNQGTATNFGATGSASWNTTVKTSTFTAVAGEGYFVNTTGGAVSVNLPAGTAGAVVAVKDYANTFDTNACTLVQNGSDKIGGLTDNSILSTEGIAVTLVYVDSTQGWLVTDSGLQDEAPGPQFITATGGTITTVCTNFKVHTFTGPGTFTVCSTGNAAGSNTVDYLVVAGGGGGAKTGGASYAAAGGGGAGGFRESPGTASGSYSVSPLGTSPAVALSVPATSYPITVGAGGSGGTGSGGAGGGSIGSSGSNSIFSTITSTGGGRGGNYDGDANDGGSGGGAANGSSPTGGNGNTPSVSPAQGNDGGDRPTGDGGAGGGGATVSGSNVSSNAGAAGGVGATTSINATPTAYAGGAGGGGYGTSGGSGGTGGGGAGGGQTGPGSTSTAGTAGTTNTGGGGGSGGGTQTQPTGGAGGSGGSGIVIIRYKFQ